MTHRSNLDRSRQVSAWLRPGRVVRLYFPVARKDKLFVIGTLGRYPLLLAINTDPRIQGSAFQVRMGTDHPFLRWTSYINCYQPIGVLSMNAILIQISRDASRMAGTLSADVLAETIIAIERSRRMPERRRAALLSALNPQGKGLLYGR